MVVFSQASCRELHRLGLEGHCRQENLGLEGLLSLSLSLSLSGEAGPGVIGQNWSREKNKR